MDLLTKGVTKDGFLRIYLVNCRETVDTARKLHNLSPLASAVLGRTLAAGHLMGAMLKSENATVTIQIKGGGEAGLIIAVANAWGEVKGYISNPAVELPLNRSGKLDVGRAVGKNGYLSVIRDLKMKEPYIGHVPLQTGEIGDDIAFYFAQSEQIPGAVGLGVLVDTDLSISASGGFIIQVMPDCDELSIKRLEKSVENIKSVTDMLKSGKSNEELIREIMKDFEVDILEEQEVKYKCDCSRERMEKAIISLGRQEIQDMIEEQGEAETECRFCGGKYLFTRADLERMLELSKNKDN